MCELYKGGQCVFTGFHFKGAIMMNRVSTRGIKLLDENEIQEKCKISFAVDLLALLD